MRVYIHSLIICFHLLNTSFVDVKSLEIGMRETKNKFYLHKDETDVKKIKRLLKNAEDSAVYIEKHVVQGKLNEKGNYRM